MNIDTTKKIYVQDTTLRDGMHAIRHSYTPDQVRSIASALDKAGVSGIEVTHGDGLRGSSFNYGFGTHTDLEWIEAAAEVVENAKLTVLLLPGIGTVEDLKNAYDAGARSVRVATHCTEADVSAQHIRWAREKGMDVACLLMLAHMTDPKGFAQQAKLMESYGAHCIYVTDSAGALLIDGVVDRFKAMADTAIVRLFCAVSTVWRPTSPRLPGCHSSSWSTRWKNCLTASSPGCPPPTTRTCVAIHAYCSSSSPCFRKIARNANNLACSMGAMEPPLASRNARTNTIAACCVRERG